MNRSFQILVQSHILLVSICHCVFSLFPSCARQDRYFKKIHKKSQCFLIIQLIKNKKNNSCKIPTLTHLKSLINSQNSYEVLTICKKTNSCLKDRYTIMIWCDMYKLICESYQWNKKGFTEEVERGGYKKEKGRKPFYLEVRIGAQRSGTWHLGCFLGNWKEKHETHERNQRGIFGKTLGRTSRATMETWSSLPTHNDSYPWES